MVLLRFDHSAVFTCLTGMFVMSLSVVRLRQGLVGLCVSALGLPVALAQGVGAALPSLELALHNPASAGALVYRGSTYAPQAGPNAEPLYRYERRVQVADGILTASHITREPSGQALIVESARMSSDYRLQRLQVLNHQAGYAGTVSVSADGRHLVYELKDNGRLSTSQETVSDPVVSGPSLFGYVLSHWDLLQGGARLPVRMVALKDATTYGFELKYEGQNQQELSFTLTPSSFWVRLALAPLRVVFDASTRRPLRYEGRVPPMEKHQGKLRDLDARVVYSAESATYR